MQTKSEFGVWGGAIYPHIVIRHLHQPILSVTHHIQPCRAVHTLLFYIYNVKDGTYTAGMAHGRWYIILLACFCTVRNKHPYTPPSPLYCFRQSIVIRFCMIAGRFFVRYILHCFFYFQCIIFCTVLCNIACAVLQSLVSVHYILHYFVRYCLRIFAEYIFCAL